MRPPKGYLANPPSKRRNAKFNMTFSVSPAELIAAAEQLGTLAPDGATEVVWKLKAELRFRRTPAEPDRLAVQCSFEVAAVEEGKG